jgi:hypothetical protein
VLKILNEIAVLKNKNLPKSVFRHQKNIITFAATNYKENII